MLFAVQAGLDLRASDLQLYRVARLVTAACLRARLILSADEKRVPARARPCRLAAPGALRWSLRAHRRRTLTRRRAARAVGTPAARRGFPSRASHFTRPHRLVSSVALGAYAATSTENVTAGRSAGTGSAIKEGDAIRTQSPCPPACAWRPRPGSRPSWSARGRSATWR